jgi:hypothetical protein
MSSTPGDFGQVLWRPLESLLAQVVKGLTTAHHDWSSSVSRAPGCRDWGGRHRLSGGPHLTSPDHCPQQGIRRTHRIFQMRGAPPFLASMSMSTPAGVTGPTPSGRPGGKPALEDNPPSGKHKGEAEDRILISEVSPIVLPAANWGLAPDTGGRAGRLHTSLCRFPVYRSFNRTHITRLTYGAACYAIRTPPRVS